MRSTLVLLAVALAAPAAALNPTPANCDTADDAGSGLDASESAPVAVGEGTHAGCVDADDGDPSEGYLVTVAPGERMAATFHWSGSCFVYLTVYEVHEDASRELLRGLGGTICAPYAIHSDQDEPGTYLLVFTIDQPSRSGTPYSFVLEVGPDVLGSCGAQDDAASGGDAPLRRPVPLGEGRGCIDERDWDDAYTFTLDEPSRVILRLESSDPCWVVEGFILPHGSRDYYVDGWWYDAWDCESRSWGFELPAGTYDLIHMPIMLDHPQAIRYDLDLAVVEHGMCGPQDDGGRGRDSSLADRAPIAYGQSLAGCLDEFDHADAFVLDVGAGDVFKVTVASVDGCHAPFLAATPESKQPSFASKSGCGYTYAYRAGATERWNLQLFGEGTLDRDLGPYTIGVERCRSTGGVLAILSPADACKVGELLATTMDLGARGATPYPVSHRYARG